MRKTILTLIISTLFACTPSTQTNSKAVETSELEDTTSTKPDQPEPIELKVEIYPEIAVNFINSYVENANKMSKAVETRDWVKSSKLVTDNFKTELVNIINEAFERDPEYGLGFDPIMDAQDNPNEFVITEFDDKTGIVKLRGKQWESFTLNIKLVVDDGKTLVDGCGVVNLTEEERAKRDW